jgi:hypothetical protein
MSWTSTAKTCGPLGVFGPHFENLSSTKLCVVIAQKTTYNLYIHRPESVKSHICNVFVCLVAHSKFYCA